MQIALRWLSAAALAAVILAPHPRPGRSKRTRGDGPRPGTLADITGQTDFSFGRPVFDSGVYSVTWIGGVTAWRGLTTIGAGEQLLFDPGPVDAGATRTITMTDQWTLWATTPDLARAESTGDQWAFASMSAGTWIWGMEDILMGRCDCDYQDAYGLLTRIGDVVTPLEAAAVPPPLPSPQDDLGPKASVIPEPTTIGLIALGVAGLASIRKRKRARPVTAEPLDNEALSKRLI